MTLSGVDGVTIDGRTPPMLPVMELQAILREPQGTYVSRAEEQLHACKVHRFTLHQAHVTLVYPLPQSSRRDLGGHPCQPNGRIQLWRWLQLNGVAVEPNAELAGTGGL